MRLSKPRNIAARIVAPGASMVTLVGFFAWAAVAAKYETLGTGLYGDAFGAAAGLASALAAVLALWAIQIQQKELENTREEIASQRQTLRQQNALTAREIAVELLRHDREAVAHVFDLVIGRKTLQTSGPQLEQGNTSMFNFYYGKLNAWLDTSIQELEVLSAIEEEAMRGEVSAPVDYDAKATEQGAVRFTPLALLVCAGAVLAMFVGWFALVVRHEGHVPGTALFGDAFAPLTGFATAMALILALWSVLLQQRELGLTRIEMVGQRAEMQQQNLLRIAQVRLAHIQFHRESLAGILDVLVHNRPLLTGDRSETSNATMTRVVEVLADWGPRASTSLLRAQGFELEAKPTAATPPADP